MPRNRPLGPIGCAALGLLLVGLALFLSAAFSGTPASLGVGAGFASRFTGDARLRLLGLAGSNNAAPQVDDAAAVRLVTSAATTTALLASLDDYAELLLTSLHLLYQSPSAEFPRAVLVSLTTAAPVVAATVETGGAGPASRYDIAALFTLAACRALPTLSPADRVALAPTARAALSNVLARVDPVELSVDDSDAALFNVTPSPTTSDFLKSFGGSKYTAPGSGGHALATASLRQAQAIAALRCVAAGARKRWAPETNANANASAQQSGSSTTDAHLFFGLRTSVEGGFLLGAAESLRRGLRSFYLAPADAGGDGFGPFDIGATRDHRRARGATLDVALLLFFLDPEDIPVSVLGDIASAGGYLATPAGLANGHASAALTDATWAVSPLGNALALAGALKHLLPAVSRAHALADEPADEGDADVAQANTDGWFGAGVADSSFGNADAEWVSVDALVSLLDDILRVGAPLDAAGKEAALRTAEEARRAAKVGASGGSSMAALTYPAFFVPLSSQETTIAPRGVTGRAAAWVRGALRAGVDAAQPPLNAPETTADAQPRSGATPSYGGYPAHGLPVVRGVDASVDEHVVVRLAPLPALATTTRSHLYESAHSRVEWSDADADSQGVGAGVGRAVRVRGAGARAHVGTAVAASFFRRLFESAEEWTARADAALALASTRHPSQSPLPRLEAVASHLRSATLWPARALRALRAARRGGAFSSAALPPLAAHKMLRFFASGAADVLILSAEFEFGDSAARRVWHAASSSAVVYATSQASTVFLDIGEADLVAAPTDAVERAASSPSVADAAAPTKASSKDSHLTPPVGAYVHDATENTTAEAMGHTTPRKLRRDPSLSHAPPADPTPAVAANVVAAEDDVASVSPLTPAVSPAPIPRHRVTVNVLELFARLCSDNSSVGTAWGDTCCAPGALSLLSRSDTGDTAIAEHVDANAIPTFICLESDSAASWPGRGLRESIRVSCAAVRDDFCDCTGDAADEDKSAACAAVPGAKFRCGPAGATRASSGELVAVTDEVGDENDSALFIDASKVGDGVRDCIGGEDEDAL